MYKPSEKFGSLRINHYLCAIKGKLLRHRIMQQRKLPLGIQDFEEMRRDGYLYVDKTDMVWQMANGNKYNYFSRPRRFGKSLLCSTLKCYFEGRRDLFEGLKIMQIEKEWVKRPIIYLSMSLGGSTGQSLCQYLDLALSSYEKIYGKNPDEQTLGNRLNGIIQRAYEQSGVQIAVIVDEYDVPLQHTYDTDIHEDIRTVYRNFFTGLKDYGYCIKCVFITGITKFTQISLFSMLNTLKNMSFRNEYATLCGIAKEELSDNFMPEIEQLAASYAITTEDVMARMKYTYDGYHFSRSMVDVYNPFSVFNAFVDLRLNSFWIATGSNEMLFKILHKFISAIPTLDGCLIDADYLEMSDVNMVDPKIFLYQSGYLTIKEVKGDTYVLGYPNREVKKAMFNMVLPIMLNKETSQGSTDIQSLKMAMIAGDVDQAMLCLKQLIACTPYSTQKKEKFVFEEHFRFIIKNLFYICGFVAHEEVEMASGRIDITVEIPNIIYVLELKMDDNGGVDAAADQVTDSHYADLDSKCIEDYAGPLLPYCWEDKYLNSKYKLIVIGQETNGWYSDYMNSDEDIKKNIEVYKSFGLGKKVKTLFWKYVHEFNYLLNGIDNQNFIWDNINKFGKDSGKGKPVPDVLDCERVYFNVSCSELAILKPDVCLFMTGPKYDKDVKNKIPDVKFSTFGTYKMREVAKLCSSSLPKKSYRIYHPQYALYNRDWYNKMISNVLKSCIGEFD